MPLKLPLRLRPAFHGYFAPVHCYVQKPLTKICRPAGAAARAFFTPAGKDCIPGAKWPGHGLGQSSRSGSVKSGARPEKRPVNARLRDSHITDISPLREAVT